MKISQKVFWIFFIIIFFTLVLAANQIFIYYSQKRFNRATSHINHLQTQVRQLDQLWIALSLPDKQFNRAEYDRLAAESLQTSRQLTESVADLPVVIFEQLNNMNFNLQNFRQALLDFAEVRNLTMRLETSIHQTLQNLHTHPQLNLKHQKEIAGGTQHYYEKNSIDNAIAYLQLHFQVSSFVHHRQYRHLPRIKQAVARLKEQESKLGIAVELDLLVQLLEKYYLRNLQLTDHKQFVETSANNFLEVTQQLLVKLEEHSMKKQRQVSKLSLLVSILGLLAAILFWYRIRVYLRRFLFNQRQVMQTIQSGSSNVQLVSQSQDELGDLTTAMKDLSVELYKKKADLLESEQKYRSLIENLTDWVWETDVNHCFSFCSVAGETISGHSQETLLGNRYLALSEACEEHEVLEHIERHFRTRTAFTNTERKIRCGDGAIKHLIANGTPQFDSAGTFIGFRGVDHDITELVNARQAQDQLEMELQHAQKMESIGRLAGGVAHDFNNILSAIIGYCELVMYELEPDHRCFRYIKEINGAGERAAGLTKQLLAFSRKQARTPQNLGLAKELKVLEDMLHRLVGEQICLTMRIDEGIWPVLMDKSQFEQVVVNLTVNANDAMPDGGKINISLTNCSLDSSFSSGESINLPPGNYVQLTVSDTGCGISKEVLQRIFDPFFTTKGRDKGTGLGLAMVYGIMTQNNGNVQVHSELGKGSSFHLFFPRSTGVAPTLKTSETVTDLRAGNETILFVEDEGALRKMHSELLGSLGYRLLIASDGIEAIALFKKEEKIDLLITDVIMPNMGGIELSKNLKQLDPQLKVLYMSGYTDQEKSVDGILQEGVNFIYKPATPTDVVKMIGKLLD